MKFVIKAILHCFLGFLLFGCSEKFDLVSRPQISQIAFEITDKNGTGVLYISQSDKGYHFTLLNSLGVPLARRVLSYDGKFQNIGFLPPNSSYNELFILTLDMLDKGQMQREFAVGKENFKVKKIDIH